MRANIIKYSAITSANLQNQLAYIWDTFNRSIFMLFIMFIFIQLWSAAFEKQGLSAIGDMTLAKTIYYFLIAEVLQLGQVRHDIRITEEVKDGSIAYTMSKPYNYLFYHFFNGLGEAVVKMGLLFITGLPLVWRHAGIPPLSWGHLPFVILIMLMAMGIDFLFLSMIGLLAFVVEDTFSFRLIYQKIVFIFGGLLIPLDFLPTRLEQIARLLPFQLTTYAPAKLFVNFDWTLFGQLLASGLIWGIILSAILIAQYRWATRRLAVNGG